MPWVVVNEEPEKERNLGLRQPTGSAKGNQSILRKVDAAVRGAGDIISFGFADEAEAGLEALPSLVSGGVSGFQKSYADNLKTQAMIDQLDREQVPVSRATGQVGGFLGSLGVGSLAGVGSAVPRVLPAAQGIVRGAETVGRSAVAGAAYGGLQGAGSSQPGQRLEGAGMGAGLGAVAGGAAVPVAAGAGRAAEALLSRASGPVQRSITALSRRGGRNVADMRQQAAGYRAQGFEPTLVDVTDDSGRALIRSAAGRMTPARQTVRDFATGRSTGLPGEMSRVARDTMSSDPRTPMQIATELGQGRANQAAAEFGGVRGDLVDIGENARGILGVPDVQRAVEASIRRERDPAARQALQALLDDPNAPITVGMADRISRVLGSQAQGLRATDRDLATTLQGYADAIRDPTRAASTGYAGALDNYAAQSRLMEGAERGQDFLARNTDEFVADTQGMSDAERLLARATGRRAVERAAGENVSAAPGVARRLYTAPEQLQRNEALLGADAVPFQEGMRTAADFVDNAQFVNPRAGSKTSGALQDDAAVNGMFDVGRGVASAARGNPLPLIETVVDRMRTAGMSNQEAQSLAEIAIDPNRLDEVLNILERRFPPSVAQDIASLLRQGGSREAGENRTPAVWVEAIGDQAYTPAGQPAGRWVPVQ